MVPAVIFPTRQTFRFELSAYSPIALAAITKVADVADDILLKGVLD